MNLVQISQDALQGKLAKMSQSQLEHALQQFEDELKRYSVAIKNYPPERMKRCGEPQKNALQHKIDMVRNLLK
jgi:hypothetical protein